MQRPLHGITFQLPLLEGPAHLHMYFAAFASDTATLATFIPGVCGDLHCRWLPAAHVQPPAINSRCYDPPLTSNLRDAAQVVCGDLYPRVAVQLPMFNERAVCQAAIDSACEQTWPKGRLFVQVGLFVTNPGSFTGPGRRFFSVPSNGGSGVCARLRDRITPSTRTVSF